MPILNTVNKGIFSFLGFEIAFFLYPYLQKKEKASYGMVMANTLSLLAFLLIVTISEKKEMDSKETGGRGNRLIIKVGITFWKLEV